MRHGGVGGGGMRKITTKNEISQLSLLLKKLIFTSSSMNFKGFGSSHGRPRPSEAAGIT